MKCKKIEKLVQERHLSPNGSLTHGKYVSFNMSHHATLRIFARRNHADVSKWLCKSGGTQISFLLKLIPAQEQPSRFRNKIWVSPVLEYMRTFKHAGYSVWHVCSSTWGSEVKTSVWSHQNKLCMIWSSTSFITVLQGRKKMEIPLWTLIMIKWTLHMPYLQSWSRLSLWDFQLVE